tara:strand:+ start:72 stop:626 length:555 start_codon:yes stop_codon:yes gene_type:complete
MPTVHSKLKNPIDDQLTNADIMATLIYKSLSDNIIEILTEEEIEWMRYISYEASINKKETFLQTIVKESMLDDLDQATIHINNKSSHPIEKKMNKLMIIIWRHIYNGNKVKVLEKIKKLQKYQLLVLDKIGDGTHNYQEFSLDSKNGDNRLYYGKVGLDENIRRYGETLRVERIRFDNWMRLIS